MNVRIKMLTDEVFALVFPETVELPVPIYVGETIVEGARRRWRRLGVSASYRIAARGATCRVTRMGDRAPLNVAKVTKVSEI